MDDLIADDAGFQHAEIAADLADLLGRQAALQDGDPLAAAEVATDIEALLAKMGEQGEAKEPEYLGTPFKFADASEEALVLLGISAQREGGAYTTAVVLETAARAIGARIRWTSAESLPVAETMDDASMALFPELGADGYLSGDLLVGGRHLATISIRGDGVALFSEFQPALRSSLEEGYEFESIAQWNQAEPSRNVIVLIGEFLEAEKETADADAVEAARLAEIEAERLAAVTAAKAAIDAAEAFGQTKAGFCGVVFDDRSYYRAEKAEGVKDALARKPAGSFVFVLQTDSEGVTRAAMFSRQKIATGKRYRAAISADGKIGNIQVSNMFMAADKAYEAGVQLLRDADGVVLTDATPVADEAKPDSKTFNVGGLEFTAVRYLKPRPHWRLKVNKTGVVHDTGVGGISNESVPKMIADLQYQFERTSKGDPDDFAYAWGAEKRTAMQQKLDATRALHPGKLIAYRMGDFYEFFEGDADVAGKVLGLTVSKRSGMKMAGVPYHAADASFANLMAEGYEIAVSTQTDSTGKRAVEIIKAKTAAEDPNIGREWDSKYGRQKIVAYLGGGSPLYDVKTIATGAIRRYSASRIDEVIKDNEFELTPAYAEQQAKAAETLKQRQAVDDAIKAKDAKNDAEIALFTNDAGMSDMAAGKARAALLVTVNNRRLGVLTRKALVESAVSGGAIVSTWNGMRILKSKDDSFFDEKTITKTGIDYAAYLIGSRPESAADTPTPVQKWGAELADLFAKDGPQAMLDRRSAIAAKQKMTFGETAALQNAFEQAAGKEAVKRLKEWSSPRAAGGRAHGAGLDRTAPAHLDAQRQTAWLAGYDSSADTDWLIAVRDGTADLSDMRAAVARVKALAGDELNGDFAKQAADALTQRVLAKAKTTLAAQG